TWHPRPCSSATAAAWRRTRSPGTPSGSGAFGVPGLLPRLVRVVTLVRVDDLPDQLVPNHVVAGQLGEVNVRDAVEDVLYHAQPAHLSRQRVYLPELPGG